MVDDDNNENNQIYEEYLHDHETFVDVDGCCGILQFLLMNNETIITIIIIIIMIVAIVVIPAKIQKFNHCLEILL